MKKMLFVLLAIVATSCYPMPTEENYSVIPDTNNPSITRNSGGASPVPGLKI